uniref:Cuticle protein 14 isoform b n=1 Tax=Parasteatoda tepidariorum TaxID=114398 RepID=A0A2L2Y7L6_PARTP
MKVFILLSVLAVSQAAVLLGTGASSQYRSQDGLGNYAFGYNEGHPSGATFRKESGSNGVVAGSYGLTDADGRQRIVNYVADAAGFRADIKTNEPGVEPKDPAHAAINKAGLVVAPAAPIAYAAPVPAALPAHVPAAPALTYAAAPAVIPAALPAAPALAYAAAPAAVTVRAGGPLGYSYNTFIGHHGLAHAPLAHQFYY